MNGPDHYHEAERLAVQANAYEGLPNSHYAHLGRLAQVHATLALAAATALSRDDAHAHSADADGVAWYHTAEAPSQRPYSVPTPATRSRSMKWHEPTRTPSHVPGL